MSRKSNYVTRVNPSGAILLALLVVSFILGVILLAYTVVNSVNSSRIDSWLVRAKDAGNPQQVSEFLGEYKVVLELNGRIIDSDSNPKYTSVFQYPGGNMLTYIRAIDGLIFRAEELAKQSSTDTSYQMGLVNLEKDLGDIESAAWEVWVANWGWLIITLDVILLFFSLVAGIVVLFGGVTLKKEVWLNES